MKLNGDGSIAWQETYGSSNSFSSLQQTSDGGYIVAGGGQGGAYWIMKLNSDGSIAWQKTYGGSSYYFNSIQQTSDGGYIVAGNTNGGAGWVNARILKLNSDGSIVWQKIYGGLYHDNVNSIQQTSDGGYIAAGFTDSPFNSNYTHFWVFKLNGDGTSAWQKTYGCSNNDYAQSVQQTPDGGYIVAGYGYDYGFSNADACVLKLNSDGTAAWQKTYDYSTNDHASSIRQTADGGYIVAGYSTGLWVLKLDSTGNILGCPASMIKTSSATGVDRTVTIADTSATATDTLVTPVDISAVVTTTSATPQTTCGGLECPLITLSPAALPGGAAGSSYDQTVSASGAGPYTFSVTSGALPSGVTLDSATGRLSGTPDTSGLYSFTITATGTLCTGSGSQTYSVQIIAPAILVSPAL